MIKLSILICSIAKREHMLKSLLEKIDEYKFNYFAENEIEILIDKREGITIGEKRDFLLSTSKGEYIAFIDDDDMITDAYFKEIRKGIEGRYDCCSLRGLMTWDGLKPEIFEHSIKYHSWNTTLNNIKYERFPNHLNCIKSSIAKQVKFKSLNHGEDRNWSYELNNKQLIKTEYFIDSVIYNYQYIQNK